MRRRISALRLDGPFVALQLCCMLKLLSKFSSCWKIGALSACLFSSPLLAEPSSALMVETGAGAMVLTQRERVVIVEVRNTWLVLGVAQGSVRLLHQFPAAPEHKNG